MGKPPKFVALHEFEKTHGIKDSEEMVAVTTTPWTLKTMAGVRFAEIRSFELIKAVGY
jgi:isoleucyl-tRNA synthetase